MEISYKYCRFMLFACFIAWVVSSCGGSSTNDSNNSTPHFQLAIPEIYSPANGAKIHHNPSPLAVYNIVSPVGITVFYDFELYQDMSDQPVESVSLVPEDSDEFTRWDPSKELPVRNIYHWRARASTSDGIKGEWTQKNAFYVLDTGINVPDLYVAFGDSITGGFGSSTYGSPLPGYQRYLQGQIQDFYGAGEIITKWIPGSYTQDGANTIESVLVYFKPSVILILFGTHDTVIAQIKEEDIMAHIDTMVNESLARASRPILGTIPPVNPLSIFRDRQKTIDLINNDIREYGFQKGVSVARINEYFWETANNDPNVLATLYYDHEHPNDRGYQIMADAWFDAIITKN